MSEHEQYIHDVRNSINVMYGIIQLMEYGNDKLITGKSIISKSNIHKSKSLTRSFDDIYDDLKSGGTPDLDPLQILVKQVKYLYQLDRSYQSDKSFPRRTDKQNKNLNYKIVDIDQILFDLINDYRIQNIHIRYRIGVAKIYTDPTKLRQILLNLIGNAVKYSKEGEKPNITLESYKKKNKSGENNIIINVIDCGIGMTKEELALVGQSYYRAKKSNAPGSGLGLSIVCKLCNELGYEFTLTSDITTCATVVIPVNL